MKTIYFLASILLASSSIAQYSNEGPLTNPPKQIPSETEFIQRDQPLNFGGSRVIIHEETFNDPFNNGWYVIGDGSSAGNYVASECWKVDTIGPAGPYSAPWSRINSTTRFYLRPYQLDSPSKGIYLH